MLIKERSIITWLLHPDLKQAPENLVIAPVSNPINQSILLHSFIELDKIRKQTPEWGLPELLMPSFGEVMYKSHRSFDNIMPQLFEDFCKREECGILLCRGNVTIVYSFGGNQLHIWHFTELYGKSVFNFYTCNVCDGENIGVGITNTLLSDNLLFSGSLQERQRKLAFIAGFVATYVAVKRYIKVETIVIPRGKFTAIEGTPLEYIEKRKSSIRQVKRSLLWIPYGFVKSSTKTTSMYVVSSVCRTRRMSLANGTKNLSSLTLSSDMVITETPR